MVSKDSRGLRKARPERVRFTFFDDPSGAVPLELPSQRHWVAGLIFAFFFAIFFVVALGMVARIGLHRVNDVVGLMMMMFDVFWVIGWSVGVVLMGLLALLFLFYRESARIGNGRLVHVPRLGALKVVCEYDLAKISNLRLESAKDGQAARIRFDYANGRAGIGDAMTPEAARAALEKIRRAMPARPSFGPEKNHPHPYLPPEGEGELRAGAGSEAGFLERTRAKASPDDDARAASRPAPALRSPTTLALLAANLIPLVGVLAFGWELAHVMLLYWAESAVIGFYTALKLCAVAKLMAAAVVPFFVGHFGGFMAAHFVFLYGFFLRGFASGPADFGALEGLVEVFAPLWPALAALFVSHGISFALNYVRRREYESETTATLMMAPYRRIIVMHVTLILGGGLVMVLDTPAPALALLVVLKILTDLRAHRREHRKSDEKE